MQAANGLVKCQFKDFSALTKMKNNTDTQAADAASKAADAASKAADAASKAADAASKAADAANKAADAAADMLISDEDNGFHLEGTEEENSGPRRRRSCKT